MHVRIERDTIAANMVGEQRESYPHQSACINSYKPYVSLYSTTARDSHKTRNRHYCRETHGEYSQQAMNIDKRAPGNPDHDRVYGLMKEKRHRNHAVLFVVLIPGPVDEEAAPVEGIEGAAVLEGAAADELYCWAAEIDR